MGAGVSKSTEDAMFNVDLEHGMSDVDTKWNGLTKVYDMNMNVNEQYGFDMFENEKNCMYEKNVVLPVGTSVGLFDQYQERSDKQVVQSCDECTELPPFSGTFGLRAPSEPNPYIDERDASYIYETDYYPDQGCMFPTQSTSWTIPDVSQNEYAPDFFTKNWQLGENDLQSMFIDHYDYKYADVLDTTLETSKYCADHHGIDGLMNPSYENQVEAIVYSNLDSEMNRDSWLADVYQQTRNSEQYNDDISYYSVSYVDNMYQYEYLSDDINSNLELISEPEIVMVVDNKGKSTPMACGVMVVKDIQGKACSRLLRVLFDSGGSQSMIHRRVLPRGSRINTESDRKLMRTLAGTYAPLGTADMHGMRLPAFDKNRVIDQHTFHVFDADCRYDVILGGDFLEKIGMNLLYKSLEIEWYGNTIPMETLHKPSLLANHIEMYLSQMEVDELGIDIDSYLTVPIKDAKYEKLDIDDFLTEQAHLTPSQQADLRELLSRHTRLIDGTLGRYPGEPMHIELIPNAQPVYRRPYPIPKVHLEVFKKELDHLVEIGVLSPVRDTEWGLPTFIIPKKDGRVRWVSDMRELNKVIKRTQYTLPIITDTLRKRKGYEFLTKLDISMQFYTFTLDEESKQLCTIVTPFGPYCYNRVPMGLKISPGFAQARMEEVLRNLEDVEIYIDDIGIFNTDWKSHIKVLEEVLTRLEDNGFTINPLKCEWGVKETDWLGYWLTPNGLKPWSKKVDAILKLKPPTTATELRTFLGMVTYYRDMWPRRSHILQPFTALAGLPKKAKIQWTDELNKAFKQMLAIIAEDALMAYPNHNLPFDIYTDASDYQIGACIMQDGRPVAYYSRKLTSAQRNYTTIEKELLAIVMVLKEYRSMLLGSEINIYTDHRNLTFANFNTQRVLRWRCYVEEYSPNLWYLEGKLNVLADAFSRLPCFDTGEVLEGKSAGSTLPAQQLDMYYSELSEPTLYECLKYLPELDDYYDISDHLLNLPSTENNPLSYTWLKDTQEEDSELIKMCTDETSGYHKKEFDEIELICYTEPGKNKEEDWKIVLSDTAVKEAVDWFHQLLNHPGKHRLFQGMKRYHHPMLRQIVDSYKCDACQRYKVDGRGFGHLPPRDVRAAPWEQVDVDLIGPWTVDTKTGNSYQFMALTSIDRVTGLAELIRLDDKMGKTSAHVASKFEESWLSRYPRPFACCHDNGGEFTGWEFQSLLADFGIRDVPTTSRNPAANGICERMHQTVGSILRDLILKEKPRTLADARILVDSALATASHAIRTNVSQVTGHSPGELAFHRDMLLDIPLMADLMKIREKRQLSVNDTNLRRVNAKRSSYDYQPGQQILKKRHEYTKLGERWLGPYTIQRVHVNGNITIQLSEGVTERINIRRVKPYREST